MISLEDRINELCKGSVLYSPVWLGKLIEEVFDPSWINKQSIVGSTPSNNEWPLLPSLSPTTANLSPWSSTVSRSKTENVAVARFLSPQGNLFMVLRQSADAWVSASFDPKYSQTDSVRIATGIATIMRQPKLQQQEMSYRSQARSFDSGTVNEQQCTITLPVPHYFILRMVAYLTAPDVIARLSKCSSDVGLPSAYQSLGILNGPKQKPYPIPSCIYSDLIDGYCDFLLTNARQPPGTTLVTSRSLCADLARLYVQAIADFWLSPYASPLEPSQLSFSTSVSLPPPVLLHFVRRFLKQYFFHAADEWSGSNAVVSSSRSTSFACLKQRLLSFLYNCATHWPLNTSFGDVVSCWRAVVLPWHAVKRFKQPTTPVTDIWESFVSENVVFYSEMLLVPMILHLTRANVACPAYAAAAFRLAKVFGGTPDTDKLVKLLVSLSNGAASQSVLWNSSFTGPVTPGFQLNSSRAPAPVSYCFSPSSIVSAVKQLVHIIDSVLASPPLSCTGAAKENLRKTKLLLTKSFLSGLNADESLLNVTMNDTPSLSLMHDEKSKENASGLPKFRRVPERRDCVSTSTSANGKSVPDGKHPDFRSSDIPIILRIQCLFRDLLQSNNLIPKGGGAEAVYDAARLRWMADRRELTVMGIILLFLYMILSYPTFVFLATFYIVLRTFLASIVVFLKSSLSSDSNNISNGHTGDRGVISKPSDADTMASNLNTSF